MESKILFQACTLQELAQELAPLLQASSILKTEENELISIDEVCELLHINRTSVWKYTQSGKLNSYGIGKRVLYKRSEVLEAVKPLNK